MSDPSLTLPDPVAAPPPAEVVATFPAPPPAAPPPSQREAIVAFRRVLGWDDDKPAIDWTGIAPVSVCVAAMQGWSDRARTITTWTGPVAADPTVGTAVRVVELEATADDLVARGVHSDSVLTAFQQALRDIRSAAKGINGHQPARPA